MELQIRIENFGLPEGSNGSDCEFYTIVDLLDDIDSIARKHNHKPFESFISDEENLCDELLEEIEDVPEDEEEDQLEALMNKRGEWFSASELLRTVDFILSRGNNNMLEWPGVHREQLLCLLEELEELKTILTDAHKRGNRFRLWTS